MLKRFLGLAFLFLELAFPPKFPCFPRVAITFTPYVCINVRFQWVKQARETSPRAGETKILRTCTVAGAELSSADCTSAADVGRSLPIPPPPAPPPAPPDASPAPSRRPHVPYAHPNSVSVRHRARRTRTSYARVAAGRSREKRSRERRQLSASLGGR